MNLKKGIAVFLFAAGICSFTYGQTFEKGDKLLNLGVGLGSQFLAAGASGTPPVGLSFEVGVSDKLSIGVQGSYAGAKFNPGFGSEWKYSYIIAAARGAYHFDFGVEKLDPYAGAMLGYNIASVKADGNEVAGAKAGGAIYGGFFGSRYYFSPKIAAFGELGYGVSWLTLGLALKF